MKRKFKNYLIGFLLVIFTSVSPFFEANQFIADSSLRFNLEETFPKTFGNWRMIESDTIPIINPEQNELVHKLYSQNYAHTYINSAGDVVILVIAYGKDQTKDTQLHYPEVCYRAQGFNIDSLAPSMIVTSKGPIKVEKMLASNSNRYEAVTYWTTLGNKVVNGGAQLRFLKLQYGLKRQIPDGLLFRVSTVSNRLGDTQHGYKTQNEFINSLIDHLSPEYRLWLTGIES